MPSGFDTLPRPQVAGSAPVESPGVGRSLLRHLHDVIEQENLSARFQPIVDLGQGTILGYEGLIRGPSDSPLHLPLNLFQAARSAGLTLEVEHLCRRVTLQTFAAYARPAKLFLNVSPECLLEPGMKSGATVEFIRQLSLDEKNIVIELTESSPTFDYALLLEATEHFRSMGFEIALDDLGEGFSTLRLWSELRPDYVKIDRHFVQGINLDPVKLEFVRSMHNLARKSGARVIAEGIETQVELGVLRDLKVVLGQGYYLGRPELRPLVELPTDIKDQLAGRSVAPFPTLHVSTGQSTKVARLLQYVAPVAPESPNAQVYEVFRGRSDLYSLPVVDNRIPVGLIGRNIFLDRFARPYYRDLYGKRECRMFMDPQPLLVDMNMSVTVLSDLIGNMEPHHLADGFIITDKGGYLGMGNGHALLREINNLQIRAARYANPLTLLPGNVPINEHMDRLLDNGTGFWAVYIDLDAFKPFNDTHGYFRGDELLQYVGRLLVEAADPERDFVGHIGGDDFIILFQNEDWEPRCRRILGRFGEMSPQFYDPHARQRGGIETEDRQGRKSFYPFATLSMGVVRVDPGLLLTHNDVAAAATAAKKEAKKIPGNSLFLERRQWPHVWTHGGMDPGNG